MGICTPTRAATVCSARGVVALHHLANLVHGLGRRLAAGQQQAEAAIAGLVVGAGQDQVAQACQPHEGLALGAQRHAQTHEFVQAAGDERDAGVGAETQAVRQPGAHGQHVLHGAAHFDAENVGGDVGAEAGRGEFLRDGGGKLRVVGGHGQGSGQACADFTGEGRAGEHGDGSLFAELLARHLVGQQAGVELKALGGPGHAHAGGQARRELTQQGAEAVAWDGHQHVIGATDRVAQVGGDVQQRGKGGVGQVTLVAAVLPQGGQLGGVAPPEAHRVPGARELDRERRAPGATAQHGDGRGSGDLAHGGVSSW